MGDTQKTRDPFWRYIRMLVGLIMLTNLVGLYCALDGITQRMYTEPGEEGMAACLLPRLLLASGHDLDTLEQTALRSGIPRENLIRTEDVLIVAGIMTVHVNEGEVVEAVLDPGLLIDCRDPGWFLDEPE